MYGIEHETSTGDGLWQSDVYYPAGSLTASEADTLRAAWMHELVSNGYTVTIDAVDFHGKRHVWLEAGPRSRYYGTVRITTWR